MNEKTDTTNMGIQSLNEIKDDKNEENKNNRKSFQDAFQQYFNTENQGHNMQKIEDKNNFQSAYEEWLTVYRESKLKIHHDDKELSDNNEKK